MAAIHGLTEQEEQLRESLDEKIPEINRNAQLISPPCPISQQESNWPLLAVSKGYFEDSIVKGAQPISTTTTTAAVNIGKTKWATSEQLEDLATTGGNWADDEIPVEMDDEDGQRENLTDNNDEQGEGWRDTELHLPADLVSDQMNFFICFFLHQYL